MSMTVAELVAELMKLPQDAPAQIYSNAVSDWWGVGDVRYDPDDPNTRDWPDRRACVRIS